MRISTIFSGLALFAAGYAAPLGSKGRSVASLTFQGKPITHFLAFGDSYTYVDGTYGRLAYSFIGDAFNTVYTPEELLTNEIKLNSTSSGGPNWVNPAQLMQVAVQTTVLYLCGTLLSPELIRHLLSPHHDYTVSLVDQVAHYLASADSVLGLPRESTLVAFWIGINDVNDSYKWKNVTFTDLYQADIDYLYSAVEQMYAAGYKNFLFMNTPATGPAPSDTLRNNVAIWNQILEHERHSFNRKHIHDEDVATYKYDVVKEFNKILEHYERYGFETISTDTDYANVGAISYCAASAQPDILWNYASYGCLPIDKYFWLNSGHVTWPVHSILAEDLRAAMA
ncbi:Acetylesterase [Drechslerella dactyloides]|uniref:Acetylesterase n=1 Tax=Drechslerella dactyloides TaxID=74499 RepID=A0AAD6J0S0_DREDA|nr:Acetylesterase [Drechslerella dactyloides]